MDSFTHEVLGEVSDETRWLKVLTTRDLLRLSGTALVCIMLLNILPKSALFLCAEAGLFLAMCVRVLLGILTKPKAKYLNGGGVPYFELAVRMRCFKAADAVYALGAEEEGGAGHG